jgi:hypothetical protein
LRGYAKEMSAILPLQLFLVDKLHIRLMHQRSRLQGVI